MQEMREGESFLWTIRELQNGGVVVLVIISVKNFKIGTLSTGAAKNLLLCLLLLLPLTTQDTVLQLFSAFVVRR